MNHKSSNPIATGVVHDVPEDLIKILQADHQLLKLWQNITPLARNEWLCWIEDAKLETTRLKRIKRLQTDLKNGKRRPCCWPGCSHRVKDGKAWIIFRMATLLIYSK